MRSRLLLVALGALVYAPGALGGGSFERIVGVGANGRWLPIPLQASGPRSDAVLTGPAVGVPGGGYIRIYPWIGDLPAVPGRYYPAAHVLCLYWHEPVSRLTPTTVADVRYRGHRLRYADGNIFAALELALERPGVPSDPPLDVVPLAVTWRGPLAPRMPTALSLAPTGVYAAGRLFALPRGPWCYLAANLRGASAATSRGCR